MSEIEALQKLSSEELILRICDPEQDGWYESEVLATRGVEVVEPILDALNKYPSHNAYLLILALGKIGDQRAIEPLRENALDQHGYFSHLFDEMARQTASIALAEVGTERCIDILIEIMTTVDPVFDRDHGSYTAFIVANYLARMDNKRARNALIEALSCPVEKGKFAAATGLANVGDRRAIKPLLEMLEDDRLLGHDLGIILVCNRVVYDLVKFGEKRALPGLKKLSEVAHEYASGVAKDSILKLERDNQ
jgi:HEAT repeat protein